MPTLKELTQAVYGDMRPVANFHPTYEQARDNLTGETEQQLVEKYIAQKHNVK